MAVKRVFLVATMILLGAVSAFYLRVEPAGELAYPALTVVLHLPEATDPEDVTRRFVVPIESAIRSLGLVRGMRGEVGPDGARFQVSFKRGTSAEKKAARLISALRGYRRHLPPDSQLDIWPSGEANGEAAAIVALSGDALGEGWREIDEEIGRTSGVREVEAYGQEQMVTEIILQPPQTFQEGMIAEVANAVLRSRSVNRIGNLDTGNLRRSVAAGSRNIEDDLSRLLIRSGTRVLPLGSISAIRRSPSPNSTRARFDGKPGVMLFVHRESDFSLFQFDENVEAAAAAIALRSPGVKAEVIWSEATSLRELIHRLAAAWGVAMLLAILIGWFAARTRGALTASALFLVVPATALNVLWLRGTTLDILSLPAVTLATALAIAVGLVHVGVRQTDRVHLMLSVIFCAGLLPLAVALADETLASSLGGPAQLFSLCFAAGSAVSLLLPQLTDSRSWRAPAALLRNTLREPVSLLLITATLSLVLLTLFGYVLDPRNGSFSGNRGQLFVRISLAEGAPVEETERLVTSLESRLARFPFVKKHRGWLRGENATLLIELKSSWTSEARIESARAQMSDALRVGGGTVVVSSSFENQKRSFTDDFEDRARRDPESNSYRIILRSTDAARIREALLLIRDKFASADFIRVYPEISPPSTRIELRPRPGISNEQVRKLTASLRRRALPSFPIEDANGEEILISNISTPRPDSIPQKDVLLATVMGSGEDRVNALAWTSPVKRFTASWMSRQSGRFVVPVTISTPGYNLETREETQRSVERSIVSLPLPAAVDIERPSLASWVLTKDKLRLYGLVATVPLLLVLAALFLLNRLSGAFAALLPLLFAIAATTPLIRLTNGNADELTLFAMAASLCGALPLILQFIRREEPQIHASKRIYQIARTSLNPILLGALTTLLLIAAPTLGASPATHLWVAPLTTAAVLTVTALAASVALPQAMALSLITWRRFRSETFNQLRKPPRWEESKAIPTLAVSSLTMNYSRGFRALSALSFELEPGIIGLLGPNGAGKTTLLRILTGLLQPTRGQVIFKGVPVGPENLQEYRRYVGFLPQEFNAYPGFTAREFLEYWALERGMRDRRERDSEIEMLLVGVGLTDAADRKVRDFSGGMRQRIGIARALLGSPPLLIVDEPTTGLDIESRNRFRGLLLSIAAKRVVILSTHIAGDVEATASRILLLHRGKIRFDGNPAELIARARGRVFERVLEDRELRSFSEQYRITARVRTLAGIRVRAVAAAGQELAGNPTLPSLEEAYLSEIDSAEQARNQQRPLSRFAFLQAESPLSPRG